MFISSSDKICTCGKNAADLSVKDVKNIRQKKLSQ